MSSRSILPAAAIVGVLLTAVVWSLSYWSDAADEAGRAIADTADTRTLVRQIRAIRPEPVETSGSVAARLPKLIDDALKQADVDPEKLTQIADQPEQRPGSGGVEENSVRLVFQQISLRQLLAVCNDLTAAGGGLRVRDFHIAWPADTVGEGWNADIVVSYPAPLTPAVSAN